RHARRENPGAEDPHARLTLWLPHRRTTCPRDARADWLDESRRPRTGHGSRPPPGPAPRAVRARRRRTIHPGPRPRASIASHPLRGDAAAAARPTTSARTARPRLARAPR